MDVKGPLFPQILHTAPRWGKHLVQGAGINKPESLQTLFDIKNQVRKPSNRAVAEYKSLRKKREPNQLAEQAIRFISNNLYTVLFPMTSSEFKDKDFKRLKELGSHLGREKSHWESTIDEIAIRLNSEELRDYTSFEKFKLLICFLNDMWFSKRGVAIYRNLVHGDSGLEHFNKLSTAHIVQELHFLPLGRPVSGIFAYDFSPFDAHGYASVYNATGEIYINLDIIARGAAFPWKIQSTANTSDHQLIQQGIAPSTYRAKVEVLRSVCRIYDSPDSYFPILVEGELIKAITNAGTQTTVEASKNIGRQALIIKDDFFTTFTELFVTGGKLREVYSIHNTKKPKRTAVTGYLEHAFFRLYSMLKNGSLGFDPRNTIVEWLENLNKNPNENPVLAFASKFGIQLVSDKLEITKNSLNPERYTDFEPTQLASQALEITKRDEDEVRQAMISSLSDEFIVLPDEQLFILATLHQTS